MEKLIIESIFGEYECREGDIWDAHHHLWGRMHCLLNEDPDLILEDEDASEKELNYFYEAGGRVIAEFTPLDYHRNPEVYLRLSRRTGVTVIMCTGLYHSPGVEEYIEWRGRENIRKQLIHEALYGEERTGAKPAFYKCGTSLDRITDAEEVAIDLIAEAHNETGLPIATHTQRGKHALQQLDMFKARGVDLRNVLISHLDMIPDLTADVFLPVLDQGASISLDQLGKTKYGSADNKISVISRLIEKGYEKQIICATDIGRQSCLRVNGGEPGLDYIPGVFRYKLKEAGFSDARVRQLLEINPALFYRKRR